MGLTRKGYVVEVTKQLVENTKSSLAGHGLNSQILGMLQTRPDILGKLALFAYSTVNNKKGAKGLRKSPNFKISGYKTFADFNAQARGDVETFMGGLTPNDAATFSNENNILTFIVLADTATDNVEADIANLKSVAVPFNSSVKKEYKIPGGIYITLMWGDSYIVPRDAQKAEAKETVNKRIVAKLTPTKVRSQFAVKQKAKLAKIKAETSKLTAKAGKTAAELEEFAAIGAVMGANSNNPKDVMEAMKNFTKETKDYLRSIPKEDLKLYKDAVKYKGAGKLKLMYNLLAEISPENQERITQIVRDGNLITADKVLEARRKQFRDKIKQITDKNTELLAKAEAAPTAKIRANINFQIRKNLDQINLLKAKMNLHKNLGITVIKDKAKLLAATNAAIDANKAKGMSIQESLNAAINDLPLNAQQKQEIKQQVVQQISTGTPVEYAVQQAIQAQTVEAEVTNFEDELEEETIIDTFGNLDDENAGIASELAGSKTINDILSML